MAMLVDTEGTIATVWGSDSPGAPVHSPQREKTAFALMLAERQAKCHQLGDKTNLVLKVRLDRDLHAVRDAFAIFPHVVNQQVAKWCHAMANRKTQVRHAAVHLGLGGRACNTHTHTESQSHWVSDYIR